MTINQEILHGKFVLQFQHEENKVMESNARHKVITHGPSASLVDGGLVHHGDIHCSTH